MLSVIVHCPHCGSDALVRNGRGIVNLMK
ncbi:IS1 family transposase [Ktedonobacter sp. SOSP1-52]